MNSMKTSTLVTLTLLSAVPVFAQSNKGHGSAGEALFQEQCIGCHGSDGRAQTEMGKKLGAADLTSDAVRQQSDSQLAKIVQGSTLRILSFSSGMTHVNYQFTCLQFQDESTLVSSDSGQTVPAAVEM